MAGAAIGHGGELYGWAATLRTSSQIAWRSRWSPVDQMIQSMPSKQTSLQTLSPAEQRRYRRLGAGFYVIRPLLAGVLVAARRRKSSPAHSNIGTEQGVLQSFDV